MTNLSNKSDFFQKYKTEILPKIALHEEERKKTLLRAIVMSCLLTAIGIIILSASFFIVDEKIRKDVATLGGVIIICGPGYYAWRESNYEEIIKKKIMSIVCSCYENLTWRPDKIPLDKIYAEAFLVPLNFIRASYDDCFQGSYKNVGFIIEETRILKKAKKEDTTLFKGVLIVFDMNKSFKGNTVIKADSKFHASPSKTIRYTKLEDVEFEKKFDVFTDDEVEARYLITPSFMERIEDVQNAFSAEGIIAAFNQGKFILGLSTSRDMFKLSLSKSVYEFAQFETMKKEIDSIIKLIEHFKLEQKIGL